MGVIYLLSPVVTSTHVEGFTAQVQIGAIADAAGRLADANLLYPIHEEYFYLTRVGVVLLLEALSRVVGLGDISFRLLTAVSFVVFAAATLAVARRLTPLALPWLAAAFLLTPGLCELGFYFNDNVVSAAAGMLGLALLPAGGRARAVMVGRGLLAGAALGFGIVARPDGVLLLPVAAALGFLWEEDWRRLLLLGLAVGLGVLAVLLATYVGTGTTVLDALRIGRHFDAIQAGFRNTRLLAVTFLIFFGLSNLVVMPIGMLAVIWRQGLKASLVLVVLPVLLLAFTVRNSTQTRQYYPLLAPFVTVWGAYGLVWLAASLRRLQPGRGLALGWVATTALVWFAPPVLVPVNDGPRTIIGRAWSPWLWFRWQAAMDGTLDIAGDLVEGAGQVARTVVITTSFNPDHFLRLRLDQAGWGSARAAAAWPGCEGFEVWRRDGHELDLVRTENPHLSAREPADYVLALQVATAFRCPALGADVPVYAFDDEWNARSEVSGYLYGQQPGLVPREERFGWPRWAANALWAALPGALRGFPQGTHLGRVAELNRAQVIGMSQAAEHAVQAGVGQPGYTAVMAEFGRGVWRED